LVHIILGAKMASPQKQQTKKYAQEKDFDLWASKAEKAGKVTKGLFLQIYEYHKDRVLYPSKNEIMKRTIATINRIEKETGIGLKFHKVGNMQVPSFYWNYWVKETVGNKGIVRSSTGKEMQNYYKKYYGTLGLGSTEMIPDAVEKEALAIIEKKKKSKVYVTEKYPGAFKGRDKVLKEAAEKATILDKNYWENLYQKGDWETLTKDAAKFLKARNVSATDQNVLDLLRLVLGHAVDSYVVEYKGPVKAPEKKAKPAKKAAGKKKIVEEGALGPNFAKLATEVTVLDMNYWTDLRKEEDYDTLFDTVHEFLASKGVLATEAELNEFLGIVFGQSWGYPPSRKKTVPVKEAAAIEAVPLETGKKPGAKKAKPGKAAAEKAEVPGLGRPVLNLPKKTSADLTVGDVREMGTATWDLLKVAERGAGDEEVLLAEMAYMESLSGTPFEKEFMEGKRTATSIGGKGGISKGNTVNRLKWVCNEFYKAGAIDGPGLEYNGKFDKETRAAVRRLQAFLMEYVGPEAALAAWNLYNPKSKATAKNIENKFVDGIFGQATLDLLVQYYEMRGAEGAVEGMSKWEGAPAVPLRTTHKGKGTPKKTKK